jgi:hypothetical protein
MGVKNDRGRPDVAWAAQSIAGALAKHMCKSTFYYEQLRLLSAKISRPVWILRL